MSEHTTPETPAPEGPLAADEATRTRVSFRWLRKMIIVWIVFAGAAAYFAYDGFIAYPARGRAYLEFALNDYLVAAASENRLTPAEVSVPDPGERLRQLDQTPISPGQRFEQEQFRWLTALSRVEDLEAIARRNAQLAPGEPSPTVFPNPLARLTAVQANTANRNPPAPLAFYDIPSQHLIWVISAVLLVWLTAKIIASFSRTYRFDHAALRLTLPSGKAFTPADIEDFDKRKWDKYLVFLKVRGIPGELKFDGLKYEHLEHWLLKMEKAWPGYTPEPEHTGGPDREVAPSPAAQAGR